MKQLQSYDIDGVIVIDGIPGLRPNLVDIIITGRSFEEKNETTKVLFDKGIYNVVYFNSCTYENKTRITSGIHKGRTLLTLIQSGKNIVCHYDDDDVQIAEIKKLVNIPCILIQHDLTNKENQRHLL